LAADYKQRLTRAAPDPRITRVVRDSELNDILGQPQDPEEILREIVALAIRRGGPDNATGVLVFVDEV
jgi:protein phosphatase